MVQNTTQVDLYTEICDTKIHILYSANIALFNQ